MDRELPGLQLLLYYTSVEKNANAGRITMKRILSFIVGAMCGAVVGAAAALLFAPMSGSALREQARQRYQLLMKEGQQAAAARRAELEAQLAALKRGA